MEPLCTHFRERRTTGQGFTPVQKSCSLLPHRGALWFGFRMKVTNCSIKRLFSFFFPLRILPRTRKVHLSVLRGRSYRVREGMDKRRGGKKTKALPGKAEDLKCPQNPYKKPSIL